MFINALRFRNIQGAWLAFRVNSGTGRFRSYACLSGEKQDLAPAMAAITYALTGRIAPDVLEAEVLLSDDSGSTWTIRRSGGRTEILQDGREIDAATAERELKNVFTDGETPPAAFASDVARFDVEFDGDQPKVLPIGVFEAKGDTLRTAAERQIRELALGAAKALNAPILANAALLARLARTLEPLFASYRELCTQYRDVQDVERGAAKPGVADTRSAETLRDETEAQALTAEIKLIREIAAAAEPLLKPGASVKGGRDELQSIEAKISEIVSAHALGEAAEARCPKDLSEPLDALAKLETAARLVRASTAARKQAETEIEPLSKQYFDLAGRSLERDERITAELDSCLGALKIRLADARARGDAYAATDTYAALPRESGGNGLRTWFDRFRSKQQEDLAAGREGPGILGEAFGDGGMAELETACMTVEFALSKLRELNQGLKEARPRFSSALARLDEAHDELVKQHVRAKDRWAKLAKDSALPETMTLEKMLLYASDHARLNAFLERRAALGEAANDAAVRLSRLARLVPEWRRLANSQKAGELASAQLLLTEARDILRYLEAKERRLAQLKERATAAKNQNEVKGVLKARRKSLLLQWREAFAEQSVEPVDINHEGLPEALRRGNLVRALGIVVASQGKTSGAKPFEELALTPYASIYLIGDAKTSNQARLELLNCLEEARGSELRLILVADEALAAMLGSLGIGMATRVTSPDTGSLIGKPRRDAPQPAAVAPAARATAPIPGRSTGHIVKNAAIRVPAQRSAPPQRPAPLPRLTPLPPSQQDMPLLSDKARRALDLLHGRKVD